MPSRTPPDTRVGGAAGVESTGVARELLGVVSDAITLFAVEPTSGGGATSDTPFAGRAAGEGEGNSVTAAALVADGCGRNGAGAGPGTGPAERSTVRMATGALTAGTAVVTGAETGVTAAAVVAGVALAVTGVLNMRQPA